MSHPFQPQAAPCTPAYVALPCPSTCAGTGVACGIAIGLATLPLTDVCDSAMAGLQLPPSAAQTGVPPEDRVGVVHLLPVSNTTVLSHVLPAAAK